MEVVGSKKKVGCGQSASLIVHLRFFPVPSRPSPFTFVFTNLFVPSLSANEDEKYSLFYTKADHLP